MAPDSNSLGDEVPKKSVVTPIKTAPKDAAAPKVTLKVNEAQTRMEVDESSNDDSSEKDKKLAPRETQLMPKSAPKVNLKTEVKTDTNANEREKAGDGNGGWMEDIIKSKPKCTSCE